MSNEDTIARLEGMRDSAMKRISALELEIRGEPARGMIPAAGGIGPRLEELESTFDPRCRRLGTGRYRCLRPARHEPECEQYT